MDEDYICAVRLSANDYGILNEETINDLAKKMYDGNYECIDDFIDETFSVNDENFNQEIDWTLNDANSKVLVRNFSDVIVNEKHELINNSQDVRLRSQIGQSTFATGIGTAPTFSSLISSSSHSNYSDFHRLPSGQLNTTRTYMPYSSSNIISNLNLGGNIGETLDGFMNTIDGMVRVNENVGVTIDGFLNRLNGMTRFNDNVPVTLTKDALDDMKDYKYDELKAKLPTLDETDKCAICLSNFNEKTDDSNFNILPCNHVFHAGCIKEYLENYNYQCPICKQECGEYEAHL